MAKGIPSDVQKALNCLDGVKPDRDGWKACCPAHDDSDPSLSVGYDDVTKRVLFYCYGGCKWPAISQALSARGWHAGGGQYQSGHSYQTGRRPKQETQQQKSEDKDKDTLPEAKATQANCKGVYHYFDKDGVEAYIVRRYEQTGCKKTFRTFHTDENGKEVRGKGDSPSLIYRLPEVIRAVREKRTVYIVEGEKKVDALRDWGLTATCCFGGANGKKEGFDDDALSGGDFVLIPDIDSLVPDEDSPGEKYINGVATVLQKRECVLRTLRLPGLQPKEDIVDWIARGGTREEFLALVENTSVPYERDATVTDTPTDHSEPSSEDFESWIQRGTELHSQKMKDDEKYRWAVGEWWATGEFPDNEKTAFGKMKFKREFKTLQTRATTWLRWQDPQMRRGLSMSHCTVMNTLKVVEKQYYAKICRDERLTRDELLERLYSDGILPRPDPTPRSAWKVAKEQFAPKLFDEMVLTGNEVGFVETQSAIRDFLRQLRDKNRVVHKEEEHKGEEHKEKEYIDALNSLFPPDADADSQCLASETLGESTSAEDAAVGTASSFPYEEVPGLFADADSQCLAGETLGESTCRESSCRESSCDVDPYAEEVSPAESSTGLPETDIEVEYAVPFQEQNSGADAMGQNSAVIYAGRHVSGVQDCPKLGATLPQGAANSTEAANTPPPPPTCLTAEQMEHAKMVGLQRSRGHDHTRKDFESVGSDDANREADLRGAIGEEAVYGWLSECRVEYERTPALSDGRPPKGADLTIDGVSLDIKAGWGRYLPVNKVQIDRCTCRGIIPVIVTMKGKVCLYEPVSIERVRQWKLFRPGDKRNIHDTFFSVDSSELTRLESIGHLLDAIRRLSPLSEPQQGSETLESLPEESPDVGTTFATQAAEEAVVASVPTPSKNDAHHTITEGSLEERIALLEKELAEGKVPEGEIQTSLGTISNVHRFLTIAIKGFHANDHMSQRLLEDYLEAVRP